MARALAASGIGVLAMGLLIGFGAPACRAADGIDDVRSEARFVLRGAFGRRLEGRFGQMQAALQPQADGRWRATVWLPTADAELPGHPRYTRIMRGDMFFDSARHPGIRFVSDPFDAGLLAQGGVLAGTLNMRGVSRRAQLQLAPSPCRLPRFDGCTVHAHGSVQRSDFGMDRLRGLVGDEVEFRLRIVADGAS